MCCLASRPRSDILIHLYQLETIPLRLVRSDPGRRACFRSVPVRSGSSDVGAAAGDPLDSPRALHALPLRFSFTERRSRRLWNLLWLHHRRVLLLLHAKHETLHAPSRHKTSTKQHRQRETDQGDGLHRKCTRGACEAGRHAQIEHRAGAATNADADTDRLRHRANTDAHEHEHASELSATPDMATSACLLLVSAGQRPPQLRSHLLRVGALRVHVQRSLEVPLRALHKDTVR
jgi:hypothetical protein